MNKSKDTDLSIFYLLEYGPNKITLSSDVTETLKRKGYSNPQKILNTGTFNRATAMKRYDQSDSHVPDHNSSHAHICPCYKFVEKNVINI